jgi:hypothetical protein
MDPAITDEILEELSSALQRIEAQSSAILEFVKDKGIVKEKELAPYLERANAASSVRWRATRVRLERLLSGLEKRQESKEQRKEEGQKSETDKASEPKSTPKPESDEGQPSKVQSSDDSQEPWQPTRPVNADNDSTSGSRDQKPRLGKQERSENAKLASAEQSSDKANQRNAA